MRYENMCFVKFRNFMASESFDSLSHHRQVFFSWDSENKSIFLGINKKSQILVKQLFFQYLKIFLVSISVGRSKLMQYHATYSAENLFEVLKSYYGGGNP